MYVTIEIGMMFYSNDSAYVFLQLVLLLRMMPVEVFPVQGC